MARKPNRRARSAITGRYVKIGYARRNPRVTVVEKVGKRKK